MENSLGQISTWLLNFVLLDPKYFPNIEPRYFVYIKFIPLFLIMLGVVLLVTPIAGYLARKYDIIDKPAAERVSKWNKHDNPERHINKTAVPYFGGAAVIIPFLLILPFILHLTGPVAYFYVAVVFLLIIGFLDDVYNMPATVQLSSQIIAALIIAVSTINLTIIKIPFDGVIHLDWATLQFNFLGAINQFVFPGDLIMMFWIVACINAVKWVGGIDGLLDGNLILIFIFTYIIGIRTDAYVIVIISIMLAGGMSGLFFYNFPPAKIFDGSMGKNVLGFIAGTLAIMNNTKFAASLMLLLLPLVDAAYVIIRRYIKNRPKNLLMLLRMNDTSHLHHQLLKMNLTPRQILLVEASITLFAGSLGVLSSSAYRLFVVLFATLLIFLFILFLHIMARRKKEQPKQEKEDSPESKYSY